MKGTVLMWNALVLSGLLITGQSRASDMVGEWDGEWQSHTYSSGGLKIEHFADNGETVSGRLRFVTYNRNPCSTDWQSYSAPKINKEVVVTVNLGGDCGKVTVRYALDKNQGLRGDYSAEFPDTGTIKLRKKK